MNAPLEHIRVEPITQLETLGWRCECPVCKAVVVCIISGDEKVTFSAIYIEGGHELPELHAQCACGTIFQLLPMDAIDPGGARGPRLLAWPSRLEDGGPLFPPA